MFDFRRITLFCLEKRLSKHKIPICSKNVVGSQGLFAPPLATPMASCAVSRDGHNRHHCSKTKMANLAVSFYQNISQ